DNAGAGAPNAGPVRAPATPTIQPRRERVKSAALFDRRVIPLRRARVELAGTADLALRVLEHFLPLADPADRAGEREQHGEHGRGKAHRPQGDARVEVDVRIEL